jgi:hypothetical protein
MIDAIILDIHMDMWYNLHRISILAYSNMPLLVY